MSFRNQTNLSLLSEKFTQNTGMFKKDNLYMEEIKNRYKLEEKLKDYDRKTIEKIQS